MTPTAPDALLGDVTAFHSATMGERRRAAVALAKRLGQDWSAKEALRKEDGLPFLHRPTGLELVAVPGGRFEMGLSDADLEQASEHIDWTSGVARLVDQLKRCARPVHSVEVRPFLCSRLLLDCRLVKKLSGGRLGVDALPRHEARALARSLGLRLPSEAELEWMARDGGTTSFALDAAARKDERSRFGIEKLLYGQWAEDDWHATYEGAPAISVAWFGGEPCGVYRGGYIETQSREELLFILAAVRGHGMHQPSFVGVRLVADIPA